MLKFGTSKSWIQHGHFKIPKFWIQDFGIPKYWIQMLAMLKSWIQVFGKQKSWIQHFVIPKAWKKEFAIPSFEFKISERHCLNWIHDWVQKSAPLPRPRPKKKKGKKAWIQQFTIPEFWIQEFPVWILKVEIFKSWRHYKVFRIVKCWIQEFGRQNLELKRNTRNTSRILSW